MIATTIEQSKKLIELGIDINTADMWWAERYEGRITEEGQYIVAKEPYYYLSFIKPSDVNYSQDIVKDIPAWSLSALLGLIPNGTQFMLMKHNENFAYFGINVSSDNMQIRECDFYNDLISMVLDKFIYPMLKNKQIK